MGEHGTLEALLIIDQFNQTATWGHFLLASNSTGGACLLVYASDVCLRLLLRAQTWLRDCNFGSFLALFKQLCLIHVKIKFLVAPMAYIFLHTHLEETYASALRLLNLKIFNLHERISAEHPYFLAAEARHR